MKIPPNTPCFIRAGSSWRPYTTRAEVEATVDDQPITSGPAAGHFKATIEARGEVYLIAVPGRLAAPTVRIDAADGESRYLMHIDEDGIGRRCSCPGFVFRGRCRHIKTAQTRAIVAAFKACLDAGLAIDQVRFSFDEARRQAPHLGAALNEISNQAFKRLEERATKPGRPGVDGQSTK